SMRYAVESDLVQPRLRSEQLRGLPPMCLLWSCDEGLQRPEDLAFFTANLPPSSEVVRPARCGHGAIVDASPAVVEPLLAFARRCASLTNPGSGSERPRAARPWPRGC
ncbi:MAG TPA: hypothetical protein VFH51_06025, partial [Myxococcota bacterium]|nr:hypothetical protein [Myxococcota bacterium]